MTVCLFVSTLPMPMASVNNGALDSVTSTSHSEPGTSVSASGATHQDDANVDHVDLECYESPLQSCSDSPREAGSKVDSRPTANKFSKNAVLRLITLYQEKEYKFGSPKYKKKDIWIEITKALQEADLISKTLTWNKVKQKWKNLTKKYRDTTDYNNVSGHETRTCPFQEELNDVYGYKPNVRPPFEASNTAGIIHKRPIRKRESNDEEKIDSDENDNDESLPGVSPDTGDGKKKVKKLRKRSNASEMVTLLENISEENKERQKETMELVKKMHEDKMKMMESFLGILKKS